MGTFLWPWFRRKNHGRVLQMDRDPLQKTAAAQCGGKKPLGWVPYAEGFGTCQGFANYTPGDVWTAWQKHQLSGRLGRPAELLQTGLRCS